MITDQIGLYLSYYHYKSPLRALRGEVEATSLENRQALQMEDLVRKVKKKSFRAQNRNR